jgi:hypothetical protein
MLRLMDLRVATGILLPVALAGCTGGASPRTTASPYASPGVSTSASSLLQSAAQRLCTRALTRPVAAASLTSVGDVRDFELGGPAPLTPDPSRNPGRNAFPTSSRSDVAAWCTVVSDGAFTFFAAGTDGTAVKIESVGGITGPVPDRPVPIP